MTTPTRITDSAIIAKIALLADQAGEQLGCLTPARLSFTPEGDWKAMTVHADGYPKARAHSAGWEANMSDEAFDVRPDGDGGWFDWTPVKWGCETDPIYFTK